jgi:hypothetical protein
MIRRRTVEVEFSRDELPIDDDAVKLRVLRTLELGRGDKVLTIRVAQRQFYTPFHVSLQGSRLRRGRRPAERTNPLSWSTRGTADRQQTRRMVAENELAAPMKPRRKKSAPRRVAE